MLCKNCGKDAGMDRIKVPKTFCNRECMKAWNYRQGSFLTKKPKIDVELPEISEKYRTVYSQLKKSEITSTPSLTLKKMEKIYKEVQKIVKE